MKYLSSFITALLISLPVYAQIVFHDASALPLYGKAVDASANCYIRLPDSLEHISREAVWTLGQNSAGLAVRFASNSSTIAARWSNLYNNRMNHMTDTGVKGLDLYGLDDGQWIFVNSGRPGFGKESEAVIITNMESVEREYMLYLPLYDGLGKLEIGIDSLSFITPPRIDSPSRVKPVVFYGTSILQGACASRPGMAFTNIISRRLNRETVNLGFSGNAFLDFEIARLTAAVDAGCFVLDFVPNASVGQIREKMESFYRIIRDAHPNTPVIFIEDPMFTHSRFDRGIEAEVKEKNAALRAVFDELLTKGETGIYYIPSGDMIGHDGEATIDGIHFTDIGMARYADLVCPVIEKVLD